MLPGGRLTVQRAGVAAGAQTASSNLVTKSFAAGGKVYLDLSAGDYTIKGYPEPAIRVRWNTRSERDDRRVRADVKVDGASATVRAGEISARAFGRSTGGLFRSFRWDGSGKYTIDADL